MLSRISIITMGLFLSAITVSAQLSYEKSELNYVKNQYIADTTTVIDSNVYAEPSAFSEGYKFSRMGANWFSSARAGVSSFLGSPTGCNDFFGREKFHFNAAVGKWLTPYLGLRISLEGFKFKDSQNISRSYNNWHGDILWNVSSYLRPDLTTMPKWDVIPFIGFGVVKNKGIDYNSFGLTPGVNVRYRLTDRLYLSSQLGLTFVKTRFDGFGKDSGLKDKLLSASIGFTYNIGDNHWYRRGNKAVNQYNVSNGVLYPYSYKFNDYSGLNSLRRRLGSMSEDGKVEPLRNEKFVALYYFFFKKGKTTLADATQQVNIRVIANAMKKHPEYEILINGAADSKTGGKKYNNRLAFRRSKAMKKWLVKYGVPSSRIHIKSRGGINIYKPLRANRQTYVRIYRVSNE